MALSISRATVWKLKVANRPGALAETLKPLAQANCNLMSVMSYSLPSQDESGEHAVVECFPLTKEGEIAAAKLGMSADGQKPTLLVEGPDRPGLAYKMADALSDANVNINFLVLQVIGKKYVALIGFDSDEDLEQAIVFIKRAHIFVAPVQEAKKPAAGRLIFSMKNAVKPRKKKSKKKSLKRPKKKGLSAKKKSLKKGVKKGLNKKTRVLKKGPQGKKGRTSLKRKSSRKKVTTTEKRKQKR